MAALQLHLRDLDADICSAWEAAFSDTSNVDVACSDIFSTEADAVISPANSFGFMDGGIDLVYTRRFGWGLQQRLKKLLATDWNGELPIGQAVVIETQDDRLPWLISAPTMRVPEDVSNSVNAYLAFRASLAAIEHHNESGRGEIRSVLCPGLATLTGRMKPDVCARQMKCAWDRESWIGVSSLAQIVQRHRWMISSEA